MQITTVLRVLLDDAHTSVVTAAAQTLAVLVGPGREEEECWQAADDNPATGRVRDPKSRRKPANLWQANCIRAVDLRD